MTGDEIQELLCVIMTVKQHSVILIPIFSFLRVTFEAKEKKKLKRQEIDEVKNLDNWRPADPLSPVLQLPGIHG